jgi:hypothetical protein
MRSADLRDLRLRDAQAVDAALDDLLDLRSGCRS